MSFKVQRDVVADTIIATNIKNSLTQFPLTFTGPYTVTVLASVSNVNNIWTLAIPRFIDTVENAGVNAFIAHPPDWIPLPPVSAADCCPVTNGGTEAAGRILATASEGRILVISTMPRVVYTTTAGIANDVVLSYAM